MLGKSFAWWSGFGERLLALCCDGPLKQTSGQSQMTIEIVLMEPDPSLLDDIHAMDDLPDLTVRSVASSEELEGLELSGSAFVLIAYQSDKAFRAMRAGLAQLGLEYDCVAVLESADFDTCLSAFRAGAIDVLAQPVRRESWEAFAASLRSQANKTSHPDAIVPLNELEKFAIKKAIEACGGQVSKTSRKLGIGRSTLYRKMEHYGLSDTKVRDPG